MSARSSALVLAVALAAAGVGRAADYYRQPPPPEVFTRLLTTGNIGRNVEALFDTMRGVKVVDKSDRSFVRRSRTAIAILALTDRRVDAEFMALRLRKALDAGRPRNLFELAELHQVLGFLDLATGLRLRAEDQLHLSNGYINRVRGKGVRWVARNARFLAGLLRAIDYQLHGDIMDDHAQASIDTIRRRNGGTRKVRGYPPRRVLLPAMVELSMKEWLVDVDVAREALDESDDWLPRVRSLASRAAVPRDEYFPAEWRVLQLVERLTKQRKILKQFLFELRRSSDKRVKAVRDANLEDFRQLRADIRTRNEELLSYLLMARMRNAF